MTQCSTLSNITSLFFYKNKNIIQFFLFGLDISFAFGQPMWDSVSMAPPSVDNYKPQQQAGIGIGLTMQHFHKIGERHPFPQ